jgi:hypothetical protein
MRVAEQVVPSGAESLAWEEIGKRHPDEWVCLVDVENAPDGAIRSGRVIGHDRSMRQLLANIDVPKPGSVIVQTSGRTLRFPRIEMTDEIRDVVRSRR